MASESTSDLTQLSSYDYTLPPELIAQSPAEPRDSARLLVVHRESGRLEHRRFSDLPDYLSADDLLVANNTRVLRARLLGRRLREENGAWIAGGKVEFVMLEEVAPRTWEGLFHASAKYLPGLCFEIPTPDGQGIRGTLVRGSGGSVSGTVVAEFDRDPVAAGAGEFPLPPYIGRDPGQAVEDSEDAHDYQTVYAKSLGSAAAPTAGLHFTDRLLGTLRERGVGWEEVTLHVGVGTFRPVKVEDVSQHPMHEERYEILPEVAARITAAKRTGKRIVAVGTTSARTLESAWDSTGGLQSGTHRTALFLRPGGTPVRFVDRLITNFHLPRSTLLMLVSALAGHELMMRAYEEAVRERYRFYSYGDAMLII